VEHPFLYFVYLFDLIGLGHFAHAHPHVLYSWVVMAMMIIAGALMAKTIRMVPAMPQNVLETIISNIEEFTVQTAGEEGRFFFPLAATLFLYILISNLTGLVPGFYPPTAELPTTLGLALIVFFFTHYVGVRKAGMSYFKHFLGPIWWMGPLIAPIEIIGHFARVLSLSFRLFGNMMGKEFVLFILFMLAGAFFAPLPMLMLGVFVSLIQAFIFYLLSIMYFSLAMEDGH
jgi:F-type H+-transporting ATPase subunit a